MSGADDWNDDIDNWNDLIDEELDLAWERSAYGRRYSPVYAMSKQIKVIRFFLSRFTGRTVEEAVRELGPVCLKIEEVNWSGKHPDKKIEALLEDEGDMLLRTSWLLLMGAVLSTKKLRELADALDAEPGVDPRQANILNAYVECCAISCPPTLPELRNVFVKRHGKQSWRSDFAVRKTLKKLGLRLSDARRGRPRGARSLIGNPKRREE
jgi:hypothetical protein